MFKLVHKFFPEFFPKLQYHPLIASAPNGNIVICPVTFTNDARGSHIYIFDSEGVCIKTINFREIVGSITILPDNKIVVSTSFAKSRPKTHIYNAKGVLIKTIDQIGVDTDALAILPDGNLIMANNSSLEKIRIINPETGKLVKMMTNFWGQDANIGEPRFGIGVTAITVSPKGYVVVVGEKDYAPRIRIFKNYKLVKTFSLPEGVGVNAVAALPSGKIVMGGSSTNSAKSALGKMCIFDPERGRVIKIFEPGVQVSAISLFKPNNIAIYNENKPNTLHVFDLQGKRLQKIPNNKQNVVNIFKNKQKPA